MLSPKSAGDGNPESGQKQRPLKRVQRSISLKGLSAIVKGFSPPTSVLPSTTRRSKDISLGDKEEIPRIMKETTHWLLEKDRICLEGIFRQAASQNLVIRLQKAYELDEPIDLNEYTNDPHVVACALKGYLRDLPEPLLTFQMYDWFLAIRDLSKRKNRCEYIRKLLGLLAPNRVAIIRYLMAFLYKVQAKASINMMSSENLAIVFSPNLLRAKDSRPVDLLKDSTIVTSIVTSMIEDFKLIFESFPLPKETKSSKKQEEEEPQLSPPPSANRRFSLRISRPSFLSSANKTSPKVKRKSRSRIVSKEEREHLEVELKSSWSTTSTLALPSSSILEGGDVKEEEDALPRRGVAFSQSPNLNQSCGANIESRGNSSSRIEKNKRIQQLLNEEGIDSRRIDTDRQQPREEPLSPTPGRVIPSICIKEDESTPKNTTPTVAITVENQNQKESLVEEKNEITRNSENIEVPKDAPTPETAMLQQQQSQKNENSENEKIESEEEDNESDKCYDEEGDKNNEENIWEFSDDDLLTSRRRRSTQECLEDEQIEWVSSTSLFLQSPPTIIQGTDKHDANKDSKNKDQIEEPSEPINSEKSSKLLSPTNTPENPVLPESAEKPLLPESPEKSIVRDSSEKPIVPDSPEKPIVPDSPEKPNSENSRKKRNKKKGSFVKSRVKKERETEKDKKKEKKVKKEKTTSSEEGQKAVKPLGKIGSDTSNKSASPNSRKSKSRSHIERNRTNMDNITLTVESDSNKNSVGSDINRKKSVPAKLDTIIIHSPLPSINISSSELVKEDKAIQDPVSTAEPATTPTIPVEQTSKQNTERSNDSLQCEDKINTVKINNSNDTDSSTTCSAVRVDVNNKEELATVIQAMQQRLDNHKQRELYLEQLILNLQKSVVKLQQQQDQMRDQYVQHQQFLEEEIYKLKNQQSTK